MRLIFIRHGDPDYTHDNLTEKGKREVELLTRRVCSWKNITQIYQSPLGRAKAILYSTARSDCPVRPGSASNA